MSDDGLAHASARVSVDHANDHLGLGLRRDCRENARRRRRRLGRRRLVRILPEQADMASTTDASARRRSKD